MENPNEADMEDGEQSSTPPPLPAILPNPNTAASHAIAEVSLDDTGELDYEPSEPANSIKGTISDDEEEGEAVDSDIENQDWKPKPNSAIHKAGVSRSMTDDEDNKGDDLFEPPIGDLAHSIDKMEPIIDEDFSEPEEGEVDELEEGEVKEENSDIVQRTHRSRSNASPESEPEDGEHEDSDDEGENKTEAKKSNVTQQNTAPNSGNPKPRRIPITAPSSSPTSQPIPDARLRIGQPSKDNIPENIGLCKFYIRGQCTWGNFCKFVHPNSGKPTGNESSALPTTPDIGGPSSRRFMDQHVPVLPTGPVPLMALRTEFPGPALPTSAQKPQPTPPPLESAWQRGLKQARERMKKAAEKKEADSDYDGKNVVASSVSVDRASVDSPPNVEAPNFRTEPHQQPRPLMNFSRRSTDDFGDGPPVPPTFREIPYNVPQYERRQAAPGFPGPRMNREYAEGGNYYRQNQPVDARGFRQNQGRFGRERNDFPPVPSNRDQMSPPFYHQQQRQRQSTSSYDFPPDSTPPTRRDSDRVVEIIEKRDERDDARRGENVAHDEPRRSPARSYEGHQQQNRGRAYDDQRAFRNTDDSRSSSQHRGSACPAPSERREDDRDYRRADNSRYSQSQARNERDRPDYDRSRHERDDSDRDRSREKNDYGHGRTDYNHHYYSNRARQQQPRQSGRPLPYERPSLNRSDNRNQWRDPWRRSTSPSGRGGGNGSGDTRHRSRPDSKRRLSGDDRNNSPPSVPDASKDAEENRERRAASVSSSAPSRRSSVSSHSSIGVGLRRSAEPQQQPERKKSVESSRSGGDAAASYSRRTDTDKRPSRRESFEDRGDGDAPASYQRGDYRRGSAERSHLNSGRGSRGSQRSRDAADVATRAAAKAFRQRSNSPYDNGGRARKRSSESGGKRSSDDSDGRRGDKSRSYRRHDYGDRKISPPSPIGAPTAAATRPLSPPPPAPLLVAGPASAANTALASKNEKHASKRQGSQQPPRKPIKMTIASKSKLRTNAYDPALSGDDDEREKIFDEKEKSPFIPTSYKSAGGSKEKSPSVEAVAPPAKKPRSSDRGGGGSGSDTGTSSVDSRREELMRQLKAVEEAIAKKRTKK